MLKAVATEVFNEYWWDWVHRGLPQPNDPEEFPKWDFTMKLRNHLDYDDVMQEKIMNAQERYDADDNQEDEEASLSSSHNQQKTAI